MGWTSEKKSHGARTRLGPVSQSVNRLGPEFFLAEKLRVYTVDIFRGKNGEKKETGKRKINVPEASKLQIITVVQPNNKKELHVLQGIDLFLLFLGGRCLEVLHGKSGSAIS